MKIQLDTQLKSLTFSKEIETFWNNVFLKKFKQHDGYSPFNHSKIFGSWHDITTSERRVYEFFKLIEEFNRLEKGHFQTNKNEDSNPINYFSIKLLNLLNKEGLNITEVFLNTQKNEPENTNNWTYDSIIEPYLQYLDVNNEIIPNSLLVQFISEIKENKQYYSYQSADDNINTYIQLLKVIPQNKITYDWFSEQLELFCLIRESHSRELTNHCKWLNYDSQKQIFDYVNEYFPDKITEKKEYYSNVFDAEVFSVKRLHQGSIDINIHQLIHQYNLQQKDFTHLASISEVCLSVVAGAEFLELIHENILISNINKKQTNSNITLTFSTNNYEDLVSFEKILLTSLKGVLDVHDQIRINWSDYGGEDELITNMDAKFIFQHYLFKNLQDTVPNNNTKTKKMKV